MSRTRLVKGKIFDFAEKFSYHSESSIIESSTVFYEEKSETVILHGGNPENPPSADLVDYYVKIRIKDPANYKGEFGFDWIDIDPVSEEIQKIQDVGFSDVEYFYKKGATVNDLGDIIAKSADESGAKTAIKESYKFPDSLKPCTDGRIDRPFVLIKLNQEISLSLEVNIPKGGTLADEKIYLTDDEFYSFEMIGGTKDPATKRTEIKVSSDKQVVELKIKCLKESSSEKKYTILQESPMKKGNPVGGFFMMENKVLKLKFRVIALVSSDGFPATKAQALFQKFKDNDVKKYLNENSLNQAGYEVEIENQAMFDTLGSGDLDDYFYAFDKTDWTTKKYFSNITKQKYDVIPGTNTCKPGSVDASGNCLKVPVSTDVITEDDQIDDKAFELYQEKLKKKVPSKNYEGGVIILCDYESPSDTSAFSRTSPLNHYKLFVYSTSIGEKDHYAHEIGHMLGLPHLFFDTKEKDAYKIAKENILGNGKPETIIKDGKNIPNPECILPINEQINKSLTESKYYIRTEVYAKKSTIKRQLQLSINYFTTEKSNEQRDKTRIETAFRGQPDTVIVAGSGTKTQTKGVYIGLCNTKITQYTNYLNDNNIAMSEINALTDNDKIKKHSFKMIFKASHYTAILRESNVYYKNVINQIHPNYLMFIQGKTKNIMDYHNERIVFLHNQIKVMRDDSANY